MSNNSLWNLANQEYEKMQQEELNPPDTEKIDNNASLMDLANRFNDEQPLAEAPQEERGFLSAAFAGGKAGAAGVLGGQADLAETFIGVGGDVGDYLNDVARSNARKKEYTIAEMLPFASDYWTNPEGAAYDVGSQVGSMAALGGEAAAASAALSAAGVGGASALASTAAAKAAQMGLPWLSKVLNSKAGVAMVGNMLTTPFEAGSEAGSTARTVKEEGGSTDEAQAAAGKNFGVQMGLLAMTNSLESMGLGGLIAEAGGKKAFTKTLAGIFGNAAQQMYEEGAQTSADEFARGKQTIANVFNPAGWSDDAWNAAGAGAVGGMVIGGGARAAGSILNRNGELATADNFGEKSVDEAIEESSAKEETPVQEMPAQAEGVDGKEAFIAAISGQESGGDYNAVNGRTGAAGKYQIMPENWPAWAEEAGIGADAEMTPENQEIVARFKLGQYYDKYGARDAAIAWYGGEGAINYSDEAKNRKQGNGDEPSINEYADSVLARMGEAGQTTDRSTTDYDAVRDYLKNELDTLEAGEEYNAVDEALNGGSREDVISLAIKRGFGKKEQEAQQTESTEEPQVRETQEPADVIGDAADNVRSVTQKVAQNGGHPEFNKPAQTETIETPAVDNVEHTPQTTVENQIVDTQKRLKAIAQRGEAKGVKLNAESLAVLDEAATTGDVNRIIEVARRFDVPIKRELRDYAKQQREAAKGSEAQNGQQTEQFNPNPVPDANNTQPAQQPQQSQTEHLGEGTQMPSVPQNTFEQVRGELNDAIGKFNSKLSKSGKRSVVSDILNKALRDGKINPKQMADLKNEGFALIDNPQQNDVPKPPKTQKDITGKVESVERVRESVNKIVADVKAGKRKSTALKDVANLLNQAKSDRTISPMDYDEIYNAAKEEMRRVRQIEKSKVPNDAEATINKDESNSKQEEQSGSSNKKGQRKKTEQSNAVQRKESESSAESESGKNNNQETDTVEEVTAEKDSWEAGTDALLGNFADDFNKLMAEANRPRRTRNRRMQEDAEIETAIRNEELSEEAKESQQSAEAVDSFIESLEKPQQKAAIKKYFKNKPDRKDFCADVIAKNPKVTVRERISANGRDNSLYNVVYDGIELPEKISKIEAQVISGTAKVKIEKEILKPKTETKAPAKSKYIAEIPKSAVQDFLNEIEAEQGPKAAREYLDVLKQPSGDKGLTWAKSIRNGVFKDLQRRGGINESEYYENNLFGKVKYDSPQDLLYNYLWSKYGESVKVTTRGNYDTGNDFNLSEQEMLEEIKKAIGKDATDEQAKRVLDYAQSTLPPNVNLDELPFGEIKRLAAEALKARPAEDRIVRSAGVAVSDQDLEALIAKANAKLDETNGGQYQIAGTWAENADIDARSNAEKMLKQGRPLREVFEQTGWFRGRDGKWRFYIPDRLDLVDYSKFKYNHAKLADLYPNDQLFKAYPWLQDIDVYRDENLKALGASNVDMHSIRLSADLVDGKIANPDTKDSRTTLIHEIQHHIQAFEHHAAGGSPATVRKVIENKIAEIEKRYGAYNRAVDGLENMRRQGVDESILTGLENSIKEYERKNLATPQAKAKMRQRLLEAANLREYLRKYDDNELYNRLYGEREAIRTEYAALNEKSATNANSIEQKRAAMANVRAEILAELDKNSGVYEKDVIVVYNDEKARALQMSLRGGNKLDNFSAELLGSLIEVGDALIRRGFDTAGSFRNAMISTFRQNAERVRPLLDSIWEFLRKLPREVAVKSKEMLQALNIAGRAFNGDISSSKMKSMLKTGMPDLYNSIKDYIDAAFAAIRRYPRQNERGMVQLNQENEGGDVNEHVRVAGTDAESGNSGRVGEPLERGSGTPDGRSTEQGKTENIEEIRRYNGEHSDSTDSSSSVRRGGTDTRGTQGNQQGGIQDAANPQRGTRGIDAGGSGRADDTRNVGSGRRMVADSKARVANGNGNAQREEQTSRGVDRPEDNSSTLRRINIPIEAGNAENVRRTLPLLFKEQQDDVVKTERRMFKDNGKGMLIANGTGTGKTLTGLGVVKRFLMQGKRNVLIVVPTSDIANNWITEGARLDIDGMEKITTNKHTPNDINIITYASLQKNRHIVDNKWDLIVCDESHNLALGAESTEESPSNAVLALRAIIGHERGFDGWMMLKHGEVMRNVEKIGVKARQLHNQVIEKRSRGEKADDLQALAAEENARYRDGLKHIEKLKEKEKPLFGKYRKENSSKVLMLSATPFSYSGDIYAAEGILFNYSDYDTDYRGYMVERFGYDITESGKLKAPKGSNTTNEVTFHDELVANGAMTNRRLVVDKDYNRKFVQVAAGVGDDIDRGFDVLSDARNGFTTSGFTEYMTKRFDYQTKKRILEAVKAEAAVPMIKEYIRQGKKVVLFHDTKIDTPLRHPFRIERAELESMTPEMQEEYKRFARENPKLINLDFGQLKPTLEVMKSAFGADVLTINGAVSKTKKAEAVRIFNSDDYVNNGRDDSTDGNLIVLTVDAGKEGISLHDTSGEHQRVLINLGMPTKPTDAIQMEGRIYRVGQATNAMFRYLATGTKMEKRAFMERIASRSRSAENMALGKEARELDATFADGFMEAMDLRTAKFDVTKDVADSGGKAQDGRSASSIISDMRAREINDDYLRAKIDEIDEARKTERDEKIRREMLTAQNEGRFVAKLKDAFKSQKVTKAADGVYVVQLPIPRNVWIDLNTAQAEVLGNMSDVEKKRLKTAADVRTSGFVIKGYYESRGYLEEAGGMVDVIHLTEAADNGTLHHEMFHFVHNALLTTEEKKWLADRYLNKLQKELGKEAFESMSSADRLNRVYEMEAEDYRMFTEKQQAPKGPLENLMNRFKNFVAQIADAIGIHTPYGLYLQVRSGKLYTRGVARNTARKYEAQAQAGAAQEKVGLQILQVTERPDGTAQFSIAEDGSIEGKRTKDDIAATLAAANERAEKNAEDAGIIVKKKEKTPQEKKGEGPVYFKEWLSSPSRIAEKYPVFKSFYNIFKRAQDLQEKLRNRWNKNFNNALGHLKTQEELDEYLDLQVAGEMEQKEYTAKELLADGYSENVVKAYTQTRQLIRNIWKAVNDAHRGLKTYNDKVSSKDLRRLMNDKFVENLVVKDIVSGKFVPANKLKIVPGPEYEVRYEKGKVYKSTKPEAMSEAQLKELRNSPYAKVISAKSVDFYGGALRYYEVTVERVTPPIGKITGYLPHMFEQWMVMVETEEGMQPIGSGTTLKAAYKEAERFQSANPNLRIYVEPKVFDANTYMGDGDAASDAKFNGSDAVIVSDADYIRLTRAIVENSRMSVAEAQAALDGATRRSSRNRFFGSLRHRKGRTGYNTDVIGTLGRYITQSSRYCAMQPAKTAAIPLYERTFKKSYEEKTRSPMEDLIQDYIRYNNGTPTKWEKQLNDWLNSMTWWSENLQATYGDRAALALTNKVNAQVSKAKLGFLNVSSAIVNMSQLMNTIGLIGFEATGNGIAAMKRMNTRDKRVIIETGVTGNVSMDTVGGFTGNRTKGSDWRKKRATTPLGTFFRAYNDIADKSMVLFKKTDTITRMVTTLGAYYEGINRGMSHKQAIAFANEVNIKANFDYGAADAPGMFRKLSGTVIGDLALMFRKYPIKELEMMAELAPWSKRSTRAQKARFWGTYFMLAGLLGFPGADYLDDWLKEWLGYKPSVLAKAWLFKNFGDNPFTRSVVYGIAGGTVGVDVSRRVGLADVIPNEASIWANLSGPTGSTIAQLIQAAASGEGTAIIKAWSPALGHTLEAVQGYRINTRGQIAARYEGLDRALKLAGFRPVEEAITTDMQSAVYAERTRTKDAKAKVLRDMAEKRVNGEQLDRDDYELMREHKITGEQLQNAVRKMQMTNKERIKSSLTKSDKRFAKDTPLDE